MTRKSQNKTKKSAGMPSVDSKGEADGHAHVEDDLDRMEQEATSVKPGAVSVPGISPSDSHEESDAEAFREDDDESQQPVVVTAHLVDQNDNPEALRETLEQVQARNQQLEQELNRQKQDKTGQELTVLAVSPAVPEVIEPNDVCVDGELDGSPYDDHETGKKQSSSRNKKRSVLSVLIFILVAIGAAILVAVLLLRENGEDDDEGGDDLGGSDAPTQLPTISQSTVAPSATPSAATDGVVGSFVPLLRIDCGNSRGLPEALFPIGGPRLEDWKSDSFNNVQWTEAIQNDYNFSSIDFGFLYETARQQLSNRTSIFYTLPVNTTGLVAVQVHFVEADNTTTVGQNVFDVSLQEQPVLQDFDILEAATDYYQPVVETFFASVRRGEVWLELNATQGLAKLSAIGVYSFG